MFSRRLLLPAETRIDETIARIIARRITMRRRDAAGVRLKKKIQLQRDNKVMYGPFGRDARS